MQHLHRSVGLAAQNRRDDVIEVQKLLLAAHHSPGSIDGRCGRHTIGAILSFQHDFMHEPDGRIDVDGLTWHHLLKASAAGSVSVGKSVSDGSKSAKLHHKIAIPEKVTRPSSKPVVRHNNLAFTDHVPLPKPHTVNIGLTSPHNTFMTAHLGHPRKSYTKTCQDPTNSAFAANIVHENVGPFRVRGLRPAVASLQLIFGAVHCDHPDLYAVLGTQGVLCCRSVGGSTSISNHSFGTAIDIQISGILIARKKHYADVGLQMLAPYFNQAGWYWGAMFPTPDVMHFECSSSMVEGFKL